MSKDNDKQADIALLPEPIYSIAEIVGFDKAVEIAKMFSGESLYMPKYESVMRQFVKRDILVCFNGYNYKALARKFNLSERYIRQICAEFTAEKRAEPLPGQIGLFDDERN